jgi:hypothetical protein
VYGGLLILLLWQAFRPNIHDRAKAKISRTEMINLDAAMNAFRATYGSYPVGDNAAILGALQGSNTGKMIFLEYPRFINSSGALIDPWKTPYEIKISSTNSVFIRSAGRNKRFGDTDDVTNTP